MDAVQAKEYGIIDEILRGSKLAVVGGPAEAGKE